MRILIDTEIWSFAYKKPEPNFYDEKHDFEMQYNHHKKANLFLKEKIKGSIVIGNMIF